MSRKEDGEETFTVYMHHFHPWGVGLGMNNRGKEEGTDLHATSEGSRSKKNWEGNSGMSTEERYKKGKTSPCATLLGVHRLMPTGVLLFMLGEMVDDVLGK